MLQQQYIGKRENIVGTWDYFETRSGTFLARFVPSSLTRLALNVVSRTIYAQSLEELKDLVSIHKVALVERLNNLGVHV